MRLAGAEWMKLIRMPVIWIFIGLCMLLNLLLVAGAERFSEDWNAASDLIARCGVRPDRERAAQLTADPGAGDALRNAAASVEGLTNVFESYDVAELSDFYVKFVDGAPGVQTLMQSKYAALEERREHLADTEAALDFYAGPTSRATHQYLFDTLMRAVLTEGVVLSVLGMLCLLGYEDLRGTSPMAASSRVGRRLAGVKVAVGAAWGVAAYMLLLGTAVLMLSALWNLPEVLSSSVSSGFNYYVDMLVARPFFTWADFTAGGYLAATGLLGAALCVVFALVAGVFGICIRGTYTALLAVAAFLGLLVCAQVLAAQTGSWTVYALLSFQPLCTLLGVNGWFTELGFSAFIPWQETVSTAMCFTLGILFVLLALRRAYGKDVLA